MTILPQTREPAVDAVHEPPGFDEYVAARAAALVRVHRAAAGRHPGGLPAREGTARGAGDRGGTGVRRLSSTRVGHSRRSTRRVGTDRKAVSRLHQGTIPLLNDQPEVE